MTTRDAAFRGVRYQIRWQALADSTRWMQPSRAAGTAAANPWSVTFNCALTQSVKRRAMEVLWMAAPGAGRAAASSLVAAIERSPAR